MARPTGYRRYGKPRDLGPNRSEGWSPCDRRNFPNWSGRYANVIPQDPWGMGYFFDPDYDIGGVDFPVIGSFGPNKVGQNVYDSDDVVLVLPTN